MAKTMTKTAKKAKKVKVQKEALVVIHEVAPWAKVKGLEARLQAAALTTFAYLPENLLLAAKRGQANVLLASDSRIERLNFDYRGRKKATNVLSFPQFTRRDLVKEAKISKEVLLGDIVLAYQFTAKEAKAEDKVLLDHVTHLVIHGLLHLFGFDHRTDGTAKKMEKLEQKILASMGLPDPYAVAPKVKKIAKRKKA